MTDSMRELHDLERRHDAVMVAIDDMRAKIERQKTGYWQRLNPTAR